MQYTKFVLTPEIIWLAASLNYVDLHRRYNSTVDTYHSAFIKENNLRMILQMSS
jgi:hypothetical protein